MFYYSKEQVRALRSKTVDVPVGDMGGQIRIRRLTYNEREDYFVNMSKLNGEYPKGFLLGLVIKATIDEEGNRLFSEEDRDWLGTEEGLGPDEIDKLGKEILKASGVEVDEQKIDPEAAVEEAVKN